MCVTGWIVKVERNSFCISQVRQGLKEYSNWPTYPQVYVKGELIGGLDIIAVRTVNCLNQPIECVSTVKVTLYNNHDNTLLLLAGT